MPRYAVKIGELYLEAERPITESERKAAVNRLRDVGIPEMQDIGRITIQTDGQPSRRTR